MGATTSEDDCSPNQQFNEEQSTNKEPIDIETANRQYIEQFELPETKQNEEFEFYSIHGAQVVNNEETEVEFKNMSSYHFDKEESSRSEQQPKIKGMKSIFAIDFFVVTINYISIVINYICPHSSRIDMATH